MPVAFCVLSASQTHTHSVGSGLDEKDSCKGWDQVRKGGRSVRLFYERLLIPLCNRYSINLYTQIFQRMFTLVSLCMNNSNSRWLSLRQEWHKIEDSAPASPLTGLSRNPQHTLLFTYTHTPTDTPTHTHTHTGLHQERCTNKEPFNIIGKPSDTATFRLLTLQQRVTQQNPFHCSCCPSSFETIKAWIKTKKQETKEQMRIKILRYTNRPTLNKDILILIRVVAIEKDQPKDNKLTVWHTCSQ